LAKAVDRQRAGSLAEPKIRKDDGGEIDRDL
jgi:hypothetical protein